MGSIAFTVISGTPAINATKTFNIADTHIVRFIAAQKAAYPVAIPAVVDAQGNVTTPATTRVPSNAEALQSWAQGLMQGTIANVQSYETQAAIDVAKVGVAPIVAA